MQYKESNRRSLHCTAFFGLLMGCFVTGNVNGTQPVDVNWHVAPPKRPVGALTMRDAILRAFSHHPLIAQAMAQIEQGNGDVALAQSAWFPQVALNGNLGKARRTDSAGTLNNDASAGATIHQLLYDFGKTSGDISEQRFLYDASRYALYHTMTEISRQTLQAYLQVKRYQDLGAVAQSNLASLQHIKDIADMRAAAGLNSQSDTLQAQTRINGMYATLQQYRAQQRSALSQLTVLTGVAPDTLPDLPQALLQQKVTLQRLPYENSNAVLAAQAKQQAAIQRIQQARALHFPTITVQAGRTRYENDAGRHRAYWDDRLQLVVHAPLYQGGAVNAKVEHAEAARQSALAEVEAAKLDINQKASSAWADFIGARQREQAGSQQFDSADYARRIYQDEYRLGKRSLNDLLSVEMDVMQAQTSRVNAQFDGWDAAVRYASAVDNLLDLLNIDRHPLVGDRLPSL